MSRRKLMPHELAVRQHYETTTSAERLAALEAADPSQARPQKVACVWDRADFMAWETERDLGIAPLRVTWPW